MTVRIVVISDTHCDRWEQVHPAIRNVVSEADIAVHCGDFTGADVVDGMRCSARKAIMVHGNMDPMQVRGSIPDFEYLDIEGKRIGVTHPAGGGPLSEFGALLAGFAGPVDAVLFGHIHETVNEMRDGVLFLNPGRGFSSAGMPATMAILTLGEGHMAAEIRVVPE